MDSLTGIAAQMFRARALYNNSSESPEELTFNQGDVLTVIQQDFNGVTGWWLCFLNGQFGLAPGNRLRVLSHAGPDDGVVTGSGQHPQLPGGGRASKDEQEEWGKSQESDKLFNGLKVDDPNISPDQQIDQQQIYDVPPSKLQERNAAVVRNHVTGSSGPEEVVYDVPPTQNKGTCDSPRGHPSLPARASVGKTEEETEYQVPSTMRKEPRKVSENRPGTLPKNVPGNVQSNMSGCRVGNVPYNLHATMPGSAPVNLPANVPGNVPGNVLGNVRVCVEDDDEVPSEKSRSDLIRSSSPNAFGKEWQNCGSDQLIYDSIAPMDQNLPSKHPENLVQVFHSQQNRLHPSFQPTNQQSWNQQSWNMRGNSLTIPRLTGDGKSDDSRLPGCGGLRNEARKSADVCVLRVPQLEKRSEHDRDSVLDEYSIPRSYVTLPPSRPKSASNLYSLPAHGYDVAMSPKTAGTFSRTPNDPPTQDAPRRAKSESRNENENSGYQLSFVDTGIYVDCPQDPDSVADLMESLDRTVRIQVAKVRELCIGSDSTSTCRRREADVSQMKLCCVSLRTALKEVADLGTGALASAMQLTNRDLAENILQQLEMLRNMSQDLGSAVNLVISASQSGTAAGSTSRGSLRDALNSLMTLTHDIIAPLATLTDLVGKNSTIICPQAKSLPQSQIPIAICGVQEFRAASPLTPSSQEALQKFRTASPLLMPSSPVPVRGFSREFGTGSPIPPLSTQVPVSGSVRELRTPSPLSLSSHPSVPVVAREIRTLSPIAPSSPTASGLSDTPRTVVMASPTPVTADTVPKPSIRNRPLPPLPFGEAKCSGVKNSAEWNVEDNDYVSIANEAELELRRNVCSLVGRLADRSGVRVEDKTKVKEGIHEVELLKPDMGTATEPNFGGLSPQFKERLDAVRSNTEQALKTKFTRSRNSSPSSSNPEAIQGICFEFLVGIDREILNFYADQVRGHFAAVDSATRDFLCSVDEGKASGSELVALSRMVVLAAHKLVYASDAITKNLVKDDELRRQVGVIASDLCLRLRETVAASKAAAAAVAANDDADADAGHVCNQREKIMNCMREVKYLSLRLRDVIFAHLLEKSYYASLSV